jgi:hypothetical protein
VVSLVFVDTFDRILSAVEVFFNNSYDGLFHLFFKDVIFTFGVDLIEEFFFALVKLLVFFSFSPNFFIVQIFVFEHVVELFGHGFHGKSDLLLKVVTWVLAIWPGDELLDWNNLAWGRLWLCRGDLDNGLVEGDP